MNFLDDWLREVPKLDFVNMIRLVKQVKKLSSHEQNYLKGIQIIDSFIIMPPFGETIVVGDIHGDLNSLLYILRDSRFFEKDPKHRNLLIFLGDYGDRGIHSPEVYYLVLRLNKCFQIE